MIELVSSSPDPQPRPRPGWRRTRPRILDGGALVLTREPSHDTVIEQTASRCYQTGALIETLRMINHTILDLGAAEVHVVTDLMGRCSRPGRTTATILDNHYPASKDVEVHPSGEAA